MTIDPSCIGRSPILQQSQTMHCACFRAVWVVLACIHMHAPFTVGQPLFVSELSVTLSPLRPCIYALLMTCDEGNRTGCVCVQARERETERKQMCDFKHSEYQYVSQDQNVGAGGLLETMETAVKVAVYKGDTHTRTHTHTHTNKQTETHTNRQTDTHTHVASMPHPSITPSQSHAYLVVHTCISRCTYNL